MSFDALPDEILVQIFSNLSWIVLRDAVSLVNRRWYRVAGSSKFLKDVTLRLSKSVRGPTTERYTDQWIPKELLVSSDRDYQWFACSIYGTDDLFVKTVLGDLLGHLSRWRSVSLSITARYSRFILFLNYNRMLLGSCVGLSVTIEDFVLRHETFADEEYDSQLVMRLEHLRDFKWEYIPSETETYKASSHCFIFETPCLESLRIRQPVPNTVGQLVFRECSLLQKVDIYRSKDRTGGGFSDTLITCTNLSNILYNILPMAPNLTVLKLTNIVTPVNINVGFRQLQELLLDNVSLRLDVGPLECASLRTLGLLSMKRSGRSYYDDYVYIKTPFLETLITDLGTFQYLKFKSKLTCSHLVFHLCDTCTVDEEFEMDEQYSSHTTRLTLVGQRPVIQMKDYVALLTYFPRLETLHLHQLALPELIEHWAELLKSVLITDCTAEETFKHFPSQVSYGCNDFAVISSDSHSSAMIRRWQQNEHRSGQRTVLSSDDDDGASFRQAMHSAGNVLFESEPHKHQYVIVF